MTNGMCLNKFIALAGICSRRKAVDLISAQMVHVNGVVVTQPWHPITTRDIVTVNNTVVSHQQKIYVLLNKPKDCITTVSDERARRTVLDLIRPMISERVYPVGRLDRNTTGLLVLTNDGELAQKLAHPKYEVSKTYSVILDRTVHTEDLETIRQGVLLEDGLLHVDHIGYIPRMPRTHLTITLHSGKYRVIRRLFEYLNYDVQSLDRVRYAGLTKDKLPIGKWRFLTKQEITYLKNNA